MSGHTATPESVEPEELENLIADRSANRAADAILKNYIVTRRSTTSASVTACNSHADLVKALEEISRQMTSVELFAEHGDDLTADYETGYDAIINVARAALATLTARKVG